MTTEEKIQLENIVVLDSAIYKALEPAGIFYENPDGSFGIDLSEFIPDIITYVEMCEQGESEHFLITALLCIMLLNLYRQLLNSFYSMDVFQSYQ